MSFFSDILSWFTAIFKKLASAIIDFVKKYWAVIALIAIIWFAPAISVWLASSGAPAWLSTSFAWIGSTITPIVTGTGTAVWEGVTSFAGGAWSAFTDAGLGTQLAVVGLSGMLLAPDETSAIITDVADAAGSLVTELGSAAGSLVGATVTGLFSNPFVLWAVVGVGAYFLLRSDKSSTPSAVTGNDVRVGDVGTLELQ